MSSAATVTASVTPWRAWKQPKALADWFLSADFSSQKDRDRLVQLTGRKLESGEAVIRGGLIWATDAREAQVHLEELRHWASSEHPEIRRIGQRARIAERVLPQGLETGRWRVPVPTSLSRLARWYSRWQEELRRIGPLLESADEASRQLERNRKVRAHKNERPEVAIAREAARAEALARSGFDAVAQLLEDVHPDFVRMEPLLFHRHRGPRSPIRPPRQELTSTTLLGEVAFGLSQQLLSVRQLAACALPECGQLFAPRDRRNKYHATQCRKRAHPESRQTIRRRVRRWRGPTGTAIRSSRNPAS